MEGEAHRIWRHTEAVALARRWKERFWNMGTETRCAPQGWRGGCNKQLWNPSSGQGFRDSGDRGATRKSSPIETSRKRWASLSGSLEAGETTSEATPKQRASAWAHYYAVGPLGGGFAGSGAPVLLAAVCDRVTGRGGGA